MADNNTRITQKIDRLSNRILQIGLKGTEIQSSSSGNYLEYTKEPSIGTGANYALIHKAYVDNAISNVGNTTLSRIVGTTFIDVSGTGSENRAISLKSAYSNSANLTTIQAGSLPTYMVSASSQGIFSATQTKSGEGATLPAGYFAHGASTGAGYVISGIKVSEYGHIIGIETTKIKPSDLEQEGENNVFDNYNSWLLNVNSSSTTTNIYGQGNNSKQSIINFVGESGITIASSTDTNSVTLSGKTIDVHTTTLKFTTNLNTDNYLSYDSSTATISHKEQQNITLNSSPSFQKIAYDKAGHITSVASVQYSDITGLASTVSHSSSTQQFLTDSGKVALNTNVILGAANVSTLTIPSSGSETYYLGAYSSNPTYNSAVHSSKVTIIASNNTEVLSSPYFSGDGSKLTNLQASTITGTLSVNQGGTGSSNFTNNTLVYYNGSKLTSLTGVTLSQGINYIPVTKVINAESDNTTYNTELRDINAILSESISSTEAMIFKGEISVKDYKESENALDIKTYLINSELFNGWKKGNTWVITNGPGYIIANGETQAVETGDKIMALYDSDDISKQSEKVQFVIAQTNIDGAVTSDDSLTTDHIVVGKNANQTVKSSNIKISTNANVTTLGVAPSGTLELDGNASSASNLLFTNSVSAGSILIQNDKESTAVSSDIIVSTSSIDISKSILPTSNTINLGSDTTSNKFANIHATSFHGALKGNADTATSLNTALTFKNFHATNDNSDITFNGSESQEITVQKLGAVGGIHASVGTSTTLVPNALTAVSVNMNTDNDGKYDGTWSINFTQTPIVSNVTSKIFSITPDSSTGAVSIAPYVVSKNPTEGTFYITSSTSNDLIYAGNFNVSGSLTAGNKKVALHKDITANTTLAANTILVASSTEESYDFIESGYYITSNADDNNANAIPTIGIVNTILDGYEATANAASQTVEKTEVIYLHSGTKSGSVSITPATIGEGASKISLDGLVKNIIVDVIGASESNLTIKINNIDYSADEWVDLNDEGSIYQREIYYSSSNVFSVDVSVPDTYAGKAIVYVNYTKVNHKPF